jgi:hypothetical protein
MGLSERRGKVPLVSALNGCCTVGLTQSCTSQEETGPDYKVEVQTRGFLVQSLNNSFSNLARRRRINEFM